jgi:O-methyltransferase domain/Dimerisation domain
VKPKVEQSNGHDFPELLRIVVGYRISQCIHAAVELRIPDLLACGPKTVDEVAAATAAHTESLYRLLRLLTGAGIFTEVASRQFALTQLGEGLRSDVPGSLAALARLALGKSLWEPWGELVESLRTGRSAFAQVHGMGLFDYLERHPDEGRLFDAAMTEGTARDGIAVAQSYDFSGTTTVVDVGGGQGLLLASLLQANPHLKGILFDLPEVAAHSRAMLEKWGVAKRCASLGGSFFDRVPEGADVYILRHIIHDWGDVKARRILRNCCDAATPASKILVVERIVSTDYRAGLPLLANDMEMMVTAGGKERTETEFRELFTEAGLHFVRVIGPNDPAAHVIIEGEPK